MVTDKSATTSTISIPDSGEKINPSAKNSSRRDALPDFESPTLDSVGKEKKKYKAKFGEKLFTAKTRTIIDMVDELYGLELYLRKVGGRKKADVEALVI